MWSEFWFESDLYLGISIKFFENCHLAEMTSVYQVRIQDLVKGGP